MKPAAEIPLIPELPFVKLSKLEYNVAEQTLDVEICESEELNYYVGQQLKLGRNATHEQATEFFANIIVKALSKEDGFDIEPNLDISEPNDD